MKLLLVNQVTLENKTIELPDLRGWFVSKQCLWFTTVTEETEELLYKLLTNAGLECVKSDQGVFIRLFDLGDWSVGEYIRK